MLEDELIQESINNDDHKSGRTNIAMGSSTDIEFNVESEDGDGIATYMETKPFNLTYSASNSAYNKIQFDVKTRVMSFIK